MHLGPGSIVAGKYRLEHPLSRGGMGSIWLARHVHLGSAVAVKFMEPKLAQSSMFRARFEREARAAASLQGPHIVQVQDYGIVEGVPYLVMELLQGEDLGARLDRVRCMSLHEASRLLAQVAKAVRRAHEAGLVHRDLKPKNLFLARVEDDEVVKVLDFGIVKETAARGAQEITRTGEVMGSPHYMSPEQVRGAKDLDARSDLWSLGVILFRALTGQHPFSGEELGDVLGKILADPIPAATSIAPDLPPAIDDFFARALARDRTQRFASVREMVDAFALVAGTAPLPSSTCAAELVASPACGAQSEYSPSAAAPESDTRMDVTASLPSGFGGPVEITLDPISDHDDTQPTQRSSVAEDPPAPVPLSLSVSGRGAGTTTVRRRRMRAVRIAVAAAVILAAAAAFTALRPRGPVAEASSADGAAHPTTERSITPPAPSETAGEGGPRQGTQTTPLSTSAPPPEREGDLRRKPDGQAATSNKPRPGATARTPASSSASAKAWGF